MCRVHRAGEDREWKTQEMKVAWIHVAPVKALAIEERGQVELTRNGVEGDREFVVIDDEGRLVNGKRDARLGTIAARFDRASRRLELRMPDGRRIEGELSHGEPTTPNGHVAPGRIVEGPWATALSDLLGRPVRIARLDRAGSGIDRASLAGGVTMLSLASLDRLAEEAQSDGPIDPRRFRMLFGISGARPHEEDEWFGRRVRIGGAVVAPLGNVGRCVVTTIDPDTGRSDLETLRLLGRYRRGVQATEPLPFGVWGRVEREGLVSLGDQVEIVA